MKHDPKEVREALRELLTLDGPPKDYIGARYVIRAAVELITTMQADLRRQGFTEYDTESDTEQ